MHSGGVRTSCNFFLFFIQLRTMLSLCYIVWFFQKKQNNSVVRFDFIELFCLFITATTSQVSSTYTQLYTLAENWDVYFLNAVHFLINNNLLHNTVPSNSPSIITTTNISTLCRTKPITQHPSRKLKETQYRNQMNEIREIFLFSYFLLL